MSNIYDGGPAFPTTTEFFSDGDMRRPADDGMTLRDYFAAKAMQASRSRNSSYVSWDDLARDAYEIADAMLEARNK